MVEPFTPPQTPALRRFFRIGLPLYFALIALIDAGAYAGILPTEIKALPYYDTVMHFLLVGTFGFFLEGALGHRTIVRVPFVPRLAPTLALLLAGTEEYLQRYSPRRSSSWSDFAANATGILAGAWLARQVTIARARQAATLKAAGGGAA